MFTGSVSGRAEEAINFYTSVFRDSKVGGIFRYGPDMSPDKEGTITYADYTLEGKVFAAMDSARAHDFTFNEAISFVINCKDQNEIDHYWDKLSEGGDEKAQQCGWLKDKYGVSWQVVPVQLIELLSDPDHAKSQRVMQAMLQMKKIDVEELKNAARSVQV